MNIQTGAYGNWQKVKLPNGEYVLRPAGGGSPASSELMMLDTKLEAADASVLDALPMNQIFAAPVECVEIKNEPTLATTNIIYVGGAGAGDNLIDGRGLVPELPFERLSAAIAATRYSRLINYCQYVIQGDIDDAAEVITLDRCNSIFINKAAGLATNPIIKCKGVDARSIYAVLSGIDIEASRINDLGALLADTAAYVYYSGNIKSVKRGVYVSDNSFAQLNNVSISVENAANDIMLWIYTGGTVHLKGKQTYNGVAGACFRAHKGARILVHENAVFDGSVTGKKYTLLQGSKLILSNTAGEGVIPGALAGTCDTSSQVIA